MPASAGVSSSILMPRITIVTASFNQAEFLEATLDSLHAQGYPNLEHIVIDGGSTDGSVEILQRWAPRFAHLQIGPDRGLTDALIKGFAHATGEILGWLNTDDLLVPGALGEVAAYFAAHQEEGFVFGDSAWIDRRGEVIKSKREMPFIRWVWLRTYDYIPQPSAFWRRSLYEDVGGLDAEFPLAMDADLFARMAEQVPLRHVPRTWSQMRVHGGQRNVLQRERSNRDDDQIRKRYVRSTAGPRWELERAVARVIRVGYRAVIGAYRR
jgi:glycosyltransferase involved in cell wall biosynthesis